MNCFGSLRYIGETKRVIFLLRLHFQEIETSNYVIVCQSYKEKQKLIGIRRIGGQE